MILNLNSNFAERLRSVDPNRVDQVGLVRHAGERDGRFAPMAERVIEVRIYDFVLRVLHRFDPPMIHFSRNPRSNNGRVVAGSDYIGTVGTDPNSQSFVAELRSGGARLGEERAASKSQKH